jgi:hypothetical protein
VLGGEIRQLEFKKDQAGGVFQQLRIRVVLDALPS